MKYFILLVFLFCFEISSYAAGMVHILGYHTFINGKRSIYDFSVSELRKQLLELKKRGFTFVSYNDFINDNILGNKNILVTIDDGNRSVYRAYVEVLKPLGIKPLIAVYTSVIGRKKYALDWDQLRELAMDGCEIASHGCFHRKMNKRLYYGNRKAYLNEIDLSKKILEQKLERRIDVFVYPYGLYIKNIFQHLGKAGYKYAFSVSGKTVFMPLDNINTFELSRYMITRGNAGYCFSRIMKRTGDKELLLAVKRRNAVKKIQAGNDNDITKYQNNELYARKNSLKENKKEKINRLKTKSYSLIDNRSDSIDRGMIISKNFGRKDKQDIKISTYNSVLDPDYSWWKYNNRSKKNNRRKEQEDNHLIVTDKVTSLSKEKKESDENIFDDESRNLSVIEKINNKNFQGVRRLKNRGNILLNRFANRYTQYIKLIKKKANKNFNRKFSGKK